MLYIRNHFRQTKERKNALIIKKLAKIITLISIVIYATTVISLTGCSSEQKKNSESKNSAPTKNVPPSSNVPLTAPSSTERALPGQPAGDILKRKPDFLVELHQPWIARINALLKGRQQDTDACPALKDIQGTDEFERHDATAAAMAKCKAENSGILSAIKLCPVLMRLGIGIGGYDFQKKLFPISVKTDALITKSGKVVVRGLAQYLEALLVWNTPKSEYARRSGGVPADILCRAGGPIYDAVRAVSSMVIDLSMSETDAKQFRKNLKQAEEDDYHFIPHLELAALLDGGAAEEEIACGVTSGSVATGRVLAWRIEPLTDWITESNWEPPSSCSEMVELFNPKPTMPDLSTTPDLSTMTNWDKWHADSSCVCGLSWTDFRDWIGMSLNAFMAQFSVLGEPSEDLVAKLGEVQIPKLREMLARGTEKYEESLFSEIEKRSGCKYDRGAKKNMMTLVRIARVGLKDLQTIAAKEPFNIKRFETRWDTLNHDTWTRDEKGFGCPDPTDKN